MGVLNHYRTLIYYTFNRFKAGNYARMQDYFARVTLGDLARFAPLREARILDVGGGNGDLCRVFETEKPGCRATNLEPGGDHGRAMWPDTVKARAEKIPFATGTFDLVLCLGVIEHLPPGTKVRVLREMHRVLKPGGLCYIVTQPWWNPNAGHHLKPFHVFPFPMAKFLRRLFFRNHIGGFSYADAELYPATFRSMRRMIQDSGLRYAAGLDVHFKLHFMTSIPLLREILVPSVGFLSRKTP